MRTESALELVVGEEKVDELVEEGERRCGLVAVRALAGQRVRRAAEGRAHL